MEEDIKILEVLIGLNEFNRLSYKENKAIQNLIARYKELEKKIKEYEKQLDLDYVDNNYIPKSKVKEKMQEIIKLSENETVFMTQSSQINAVLINFCRELLEES